MNKNILFGKFKKTVEQKKPITAKRLSRGILFSIFCIVFLFTACTTKKYDSQLTISEKKMVAILLDLHIAEGAAGTLSGAVKDSVSQVYYQQICDIYHISQDELHQNMEIVRNDPKLTFFLYNQVIDSLKSRDKSLQGGF